MRKLLFLFTIALLINGCSKDDNQTAEEQQRQTIDGGIITKFQLVSQELENLTEDTYQGTVNGNSITLLKTNENTLTFLVDENFVLGESILEISSIDKKIKYTVNNTILQNSVDETLDNLTTNFTNYVDGLGNTNNTPQENYVISSVENYNNTLQQLSSEDRETIALVYQANKDFFDNLYQTDYTIPQGRMMSPDYSGLTKSQLTRNFATATIGAGLATTGAVLASSSFVVALPFVIAAIPLWAITLDLGIEGKNRIWNYTKLKFDQIVSVPSVFGRTSMMTTVDFNSGIQKQINFDIGQRGLNESDSDSSNAIISLFFSTFQDFNELINNLNSAITFVNNIPLLNLPLLDNQEIGNSQEEIVDSTEDIFNNFSFSLDNSNLDLTNIGYNSGNINMTISIIDETIVNEFVETSINYSYEDETNSFSGSFPAKIFKDIQIDLSGTWTLNADFNGQNYNETISFNENDNTINISITDFGTSTFTLDNNNLTIQYNRLFNAGCQSLNTEVPYTETYNYETNYSGNSTFTGTSNLEITTIPSSCFYSNLNGNVTITKQ